MKNIALLLGIALTMLTLASSSAEARRWRHYRHHRAGRTPLAASYMSAKLDLFSAKKESPCEAQRIVEMRNAVMAAHLLCKQVVTGEDYDTFIIKNRKRIASANKVAVAWHMKKYGSRRVFDKLDSEVMNRISTVSSQNPTYFCERMKEFKVLVQTLNVDQLLKQQTQLEVPTCK